MRLSQFLHSNPDLGISVVGTQQASEGQWIIFLARRGDIVFPHRFRVYPLYSDDAKDPAIEPEVAEAVVR